MGGKNEDTIETKSEDRVGGKLGDKIRFHESNGNIHFHDDNAKLKVEVPSATWFSAWGKLSTIMGDWAYVDATRNTVLNVSVFQKKDKIGVKVEVAVAEPGETFKKLQKFTVG